MAIAELFTSTDCLLWREALAKYSDVLERKVAEKSTKKSKGTDLIQLDKWYQETLPEVIAGRNRPHLTSDELNQLMKWKLTRGKFRPRLTELVQQNSSHDVEKVTGEAIHMLPNLEAAVKHLCQLKAIGPATASGVLCAAAPHLVPFMADEAVMSVPELGKIDYTLKYFLGYARKVQEKVKQLNLLERKHPQTRSWTCHDIEISLWTFHLAKKFDIQINPSMEEEEGSVRDIEERNGGSEPEDDVSPPPPKKMKRDSV